MFEAFLIVCASSFGFDVDRSNCITLEDSLGPFRTEENCYIRTEQMSAEVLEGILNEPVFYILNNPDLIFVEQYCEKNENDNDIEI